MDSQLVTDWIKALRSGDYEQGRQYLRTAENKMCCLGVLGDILVKRGEAKWSNHAYRHSDDRIFEDEREDDPQSYDLIVNGESGHRLLPDNFIDLYGLDDGGEYLVHNGMQGYFSSDTMSGDSLASLNDEGEDFKEIAERIEEAAIEVGLLEGPVGYDTNA